MRELARFVFSGFLVLRLASCNSPDPSGKESQNSPAGSLARQQLEWVRDSLRAKGMYECCAKPECLECTRQPGHCDCYHAISRKDPICGECLEGYKRGEGRLKLVSIPELERIRRERKGP